MGPAGVLDAEVQLRLPTATVRVYVARWQSPVAWTLALWSCRHIDVGASGSRLVLHTQKCTYRNLQLCSLYGSLAVRRCLDFTEILPWFSCRCSRGDTMGSADDSHGILSPSREVVGYL